MSAFESVSSAFLPDAEKFLTTSKSHPIGNFKTNNELQYQKGICDGAQAIVDHFKAVIMILEKGQNANVSDGEIVELQPTNA